MLEAEGILYREYKPTIPPEVTYDLTPRGQELMEIIDQLDRLAKRWYGQVQIDAIKLGVHLRDEVETGGNGRCRSRSEPAMRSGDA